MGAAFALPQNSLIQKQLVTDSAKCSSVLAVKLPRDTISGEQDKGKYSNR
jgi:hypothetical protein